MDYRGLDAEWYTIPFPASGNGTTVTNSSNAIPTENNQSTILTFVANKRKQTAII